ncbi:MAG: hypothetical protein JSV33_12620 [bacterium]|nr:MAG: hypothetical protein JSV33_12620 [bacterium]
MKSKTTIILVLTFLGTMLLAPGCIMEDKIIELVLTNSTCGDFSHDDDSADFVDDATVILGDELDEILEENDASREDIVDILIVRAHYEVTDFADPGHDWTISGLITVERTLPSPDGPEILVNYTPQSIRAALDTRTPVNLNSNGIRLIDDAIDIYRTTEQTVELIFRIENESISPPIEPGERITFNWTACIILQVLVEMEFEVPDPF